MAAAEAGGAGDQLQGQAGDQGASQVRLQGITYKFKGIVQKTLKGMFWQLFLGQIKTEFQHKP